MKQKSLSNWLKGIILGMAIMGIIIYFKIIPLIISELLTSLNLLNHYNIWLIIIFISSIPCFLVLMIGWIVATNIGNDNSFSKENAKHLKMVMILSLTDTVYFFFANIILYTYKMSSPLIFTISLIIEFAGICIAIVSACLSHLILKAFLLKEQSDLTI